MNRLLYISILVAILTCSCRKKEERTTIIQLGTAEILFDKKEIIAGDKIKDIKVKIKGFAKTTPLKLLITGKWGMKVLESVIEEDKASFDFENIKFEERGEIEFILTAEQKVLDRHSLEILPLTGDSLVESYLGPKTIFVGGEEKTMLTNVTTDKFGNPIKDGSTVDYSIRFPGEAAYSKAVKTEDLISFVQLNSKEEIGKIIIGANSNKASIREQEVRVIPGYATEFGIEIVEWFPYADSRQTVRLRSDVIRDKFGNVIADGSAISFVVEQDDKIINQYKSFTVGGIANVYIENPPIETSWDIYAKTDNQNVSNVLSLDYKSNIESVAFDYDRRNHSISVGPITSELGQFVNDGTEISLTISKGENELVLENEALDGFCEFKLRGKKFVEGTYALALEVGGERSTKRLVIR